MKVPSPERLEHTNGLGPAEGKGKLPRVFWIYLAFIAVTVIGFANFQIISYHLKAGSVVPDVEIPIFYAVAMGMDALVALIVGRAYDKIGMRALITIPLLTIPIPFLAFTQNYAFALAGVVLWGAVMGVHETLMRASIADMTPVARRGVAYGIFNTAYGASWFVGSVAMGLMYEFSASYIIILVLVAEVASLPLFFMMRRETVVESQ
jgi:predicted MFS family arabinose efflux permease